MDNIVLLIFDILHQDNIPLFISIRMKSFLIHILNRDFYFSADDIFRLELEFLHNVSLSLKPIVSHNTLYLYIHNVFLNYIDTYYPRLSVMP